MIQAGGSEHGYRVFGLSVCRCRGIVAGITGSLWALAAGEEPRFGLLLEPSAIAPLRAVVVRCAAHASAIAAWRFA
jgi:hypothetical protein